MAGAGDGGMDWMESDRVARGGGVHGDAVAVLAAEKIWIFELVIGLPWV